MADEQPAARVTLDQIYKTLIEVKESVGGLVEREGGANKRMESHARDIDDHETRIRGLEKWAYAIPPTLILSAVSVFLALRG